MERGWLDTILLLGLDVMLLMSVTLLVVHAVEPWLRPAREARKLSDVGEARRSDGNARPPVGHAPSLTMGLMPDIPEPRRSATVDWRAVWLQGTLDAADGSSRVRTRKAVQTQDEDDREHEVA